MNESKYSPLSTWDLATITMAIRAMLRDETIESVRGRDLLNRLERTESAKVCLVEGENE